MRKLSTRVFSLVLALVLCLGTVGVSATKVYAAEVPTVTITPLVTESVNVQAFQVQTTVDAKYKAYYGDVLSGEGSVAAGTQTLTFNTSSEVKLEVFASYVNDNGKTKHVTVRSTSSNAYWVNVFCEAEDGTVLKSDRIKLSKHNEPEVVYNAPATIDSGAFEYQTANPSILFKYGDASKTITYTKVEKGAKTVTINYVDDSDAVLYTETKVLNYGDTAVISAPASYTANGNTYNLKTTASYDVTFENAQSVYTFEYAKQDSEAQLPYNIKVNLVDENGNVLHTMKKSVDVDQQVTVNVPATYEVGMKKYELAEGQASSIVRDYASTESKTYTVKYVLVGEVEAYTVTISLVDKATGTVLETVSGTVEPDGAPFTYDISTKNKIVKDGVTYMVQTGQGNSKGKVVHAYGDATKAYTLYYTAQQEGIPESYEVTMRYICVNDNAVLATKTQKVAVNSSVTFEEAPETLKVGGKEYIRLNGQDGETVHKYNDAQTAYVIYYRDSSIVVENEDIIYVPGENVDPGDEEKPTIPNEPETPDSTEPSDDDETPNATEPSDDDETPDVTEPSDDDETPDATEPSDNDETPNATEPSDDDETPDATEPSANDETPDATEPSDTETPDATEPSAAIGEEVEIIEEEEVPLANLPGDATPNGGSSAVPYVAGGIGLLAIIALAIFFIVKKRRTA